MFNKIKIQINKLSQDFKHGKSLKARAARGSIWLVIGGGSEQVLRLIRNMILARILAPEVFGIMAIILSINTFFESFTQIGLKEAIIQSPDGDNTLYLNGAWWFAFGRGCLLYIIAYISSPFIAKFYQMPQLPPMMRIAFLSLFFLGAMSSLTYVSLKKLKFREWVIVYQGGAIIGILTAICLSFIIKNVWALVIGFTTEAFVRCLLSFIVCPFIARLNFNKTYLRALLKYARGIFGLPILTFIFMRLDVFVIGKFCTASELGFYSLAVSLAQIPVLLISKFMEPLLMPTFSEMQDDHKRLNDSIINITTILGYIGIPLSVFAAVYSGEILTIIYGNKYAQVSIPFAILFSSSIIRSISVPLASTYLAIGKPEMHRLFVIIRACLLSVIIIPAIKYYGLIGSALAVLFSLIVSYIFQVQRIHNITELNIKKYIFIYIKSLILSIPIILIWIPIHQFISTKLVLYIIIGIIGLLCSYTIIFVITFLKKKTNSTPI